MIITGCSAHVDDDDDDDASVGHVPDCRRGEHLSIRPNAQNHDRGDDHYQICVTNKTRDQTHSYTNLYTTILIKTWQIIHTLVCKSDKRFSEGK